VPDWFADLGQELLTALETNQYLVLAIILGLEGAGIPCPISAEFVMVIMGYQVFRGQANPWVVLGIMVGSATLGVSLLYWISRLIGRPLLDRYGRLLRIRPDRMRRLAVWFGRWAVPVVVVGRIVPAIRIVIPVVAGVARGDFRVFVPSAALGILLWGLLYLVAGWALGDELERVLEAVTGNPTIGFGVAAGVVVAIAAAVMFRFRRRIFRRARPGRLASPKHPECDS
jgi:membrane protein DedA with SNARE-associated domain